MNLDYKDVLKNKESLELYLRAIADFNRRFCDAMVAGLDFTLKIEIHGAANEMVHCRVTDDGFYRPHGVEKRIEAKRGQDKKNS